MHSRCFYFRCSYFLRQRRLEYRAVQCINPEWLVLGRPSFCWWLWNSVTPFSSAVAFQKNRDGVASSCRAYRIDSTRWSQVYWFWIPWALWHAPPDFAGYAGTTFAAYL